MDVTHQPPRIPNTPPTAMQSPVNAVLNTYELLERILLQLPTPQDIIVTQRVCRRWRAVIQDSPALQQACWYPSHRGEEESPPATAWRLNPAFNSLGVSLGWREIRDPLQFDGPTKQQERGNFHLTKRIYEEPGSWTTMLATRPPCRYMEVECYSDEGGDSMMYYTIESTTGCLLLGDVMAALAECQNRQEWGEDRWAGALHSSGALYPVAQTDETLHVILRAMADDVSVKVVVGQGWGSGEYPAFSLRRVHPPAEHRPHDPASYMKFLHELVVHKMVWYDDEYRWNWDNTSVGFESAEEVWEPGLRPRDLVCKTGEYKANLVAVRRYEGAYLARCGHLFRSLSNV